MKICIVTPEYPPHKWGGLARTAERVAHHARTLGMDVHVAHFVVVDDPLVLLDENRTTSLEEEIHVHLLKVSRQGIPEDYLGFGDSPHIRVIKMLYQSLERLHEEERFDIFHSFFLYPGGYVAGLLARSVGARSIVTLVGNDVKKHFFHPDAVAMCRSGLENADCVVALSRELIEVANALTSIRHKSRIIYNSVTIPPVQWRGRPAGEGPFRIGSAGIFKYAKGLPYLFNAVAGLRGKYNVSLDLVGEIREYERSALERMVQKTGIDDIFTIRKAVPHNRIHEWMVSLDAFALSSVSEGCPNILMEAMACGLPCVSTRVGAVCDLMEDGISGLTVPWGYSDALRDALERLMAMPDRGASLGEKGRERMERFSPERERQEWESVYK